MSHIDELDIVLRQKGRKGERRNTAACALGYRWRRPRGADGTGAEAGINDLEMQGNTRSFAPAWPRGDLGRFVLKALVVIGLIAGLFTGSAALLTSRLERLVQDTHETMQQYTKVGGAQFWEKMEHELDRAADPASDLPAEQKRKLLAQIHTVVERWRPFMAEVAPLFADFQRPAPLAASRGN